MNTTLKNYLIISCFFVFTSCDKWLDVKPSNYEEREELFSSEIGFQNALTGTYIKMKSSSLYGRNLSMGMLEYMAQHWVANKSTVEGRLSEYDYSFAEVETTINGVYDGLYNTIANINSILKFADNGVMSKDRYNMVKGEALGLRAFCHFDLLRLYGPIPDGTQNKQEKMLVYAKDISREELPFNTWDEYIAALNQDLNEAETLLKNIDTDADKLKNDEFAVYRHNRMNYWAIIALKARFNLWINKTSEAKDNAMRVIKESGVTLCDKDDIAQKKNFINSKEHLFSLHEYNLERLTEEFFYRAGGTYMTESYIRQRLFNEDVTDVRLNVLWRKVTESNSTRFKLMKYKQGNEPLHSSLEQIPLIRLYEMYLIAIECSTDIKEYKPLIDAILNARNASYKPDLSSNDLKNKFVALEYNKEFYGEGQQFFQYKRRGDKEIAWTEKEGTKSVYVLPLPKTEVKYTE